MNQVVQVGASAPTPSTSPRVQQRARAIQGALPIVARVIGRKLKVEVRIGGSEAKTDGTVIYLPTLPFDDPDVELLAFGFLEHEAAHVRYTDIPDHFESQLHHALWNAIEDVRIERRLGEEYPGFAMTLKRLVRKLVETNWLPAPAESDSPTAMLRNYLSYRLRADVLGQAGVQEYANRAEELCRGAFPAAACVRIGSVMGRVRALRSSRDAAHLAKELLAIIQEEAQDPPPPPDNATAPAEGPSETTADASNGPPAPMPDASMQEQSQRENLRQILNDAHVDGTSPVREATKKALEREVARAVGSCGGIGRAEEPIADRQAEGVALISKVSQATIALRSRLHSLVESTRRRPRGYKHHGTRIAPNRIIRLMWGDSRVFRRKTEVVAVNTAGILLLDRSISMDRSQRIVIARESTLAGALALDSVRGTAVASAAFPGREIDVEPLTSFGESVRKTAGRYAGVSASGGTPLLPAMMWAIEELLARREPRKFILVATDGEPAQPEACKEVIERCWYGGIEVYGLGILAPGVEALFPISRSIQDINEFPRAMFGLLEDAMTRRPVI